MADKYINATALLEQMPEVPYKGSLRRVLMQAPAADVVPVRHGRWYRFQKVYIDPQSGCGFGRDMYKCDVCNVGEEETRTPYCPNCGAKMDKEIDNGS